RTTNGLHKRHGCLHLVESLPVALVDIDEVIEIIRSSDGAAAARQRLMLVFYLTEVQANHILELRLRQLTKFSRLDLETERDELDRKSTRLNSSHVSISYAVFCLKKKRYIWTR